MNDLSSGSEQRDRIVEGSKERNPVDRNKMLSSIRNGVRQIKSSELPDLAMMNKPNPKNTCQSISTTAQEKSGTSRTSDVGPLFTH
jgi:hypothetical protein